MNGSASTPVLDAHCHLGARPGGAQTAADLVSSMDAAGVDRACVFPFVEGAFDNDVIETAFAAHPDRLIPFLVANPWHGQAAVEEIAVRAGRGFRGLKLHPTAHGYHLSNLRLVGPLLEAAREHGLIVIAHGAADLFNTPLEFARVARAFPEIAFLMAHSGMFWSHPQAMEVAAELPNLYLETSRVPNFEVARSVRELGAAKVIWGTDSPFADYTEEHARMERAIPSDGDRQLVCGGNLQRLLALPA